MHVAVGAPGSRRLAQVGWALWLASLVTPDTHFGEVGAVWLLRAPRYGANFLLHGLPALAHGGGMSALVGAALLAGFAANLAVLVRWRVTGLILSLLLPWIPYAAYCALWYTGRLAPSPGTLLYFYPWALGLNFIQGSKLWQLTQRGREADMSS